jgi:ATP/ADP translocase
MQGKKNFQWHMICLLLFPHWSFAPFWSLAEVFPFVLLVLVLARVGGHGGHKQL